MKRLRRFYAALLLICGVLLGGCADRSTPAPPVTAAAPSPAANQVYVVVQRGQSLDQVARSFGVPKGDIIAANNLPPPYSVKPGTVLAIPGIATVPTKNATAPPKATAPGSSAADRIAAAPATPRPAKAKPPKAKSAAPEVIPLD
jgi:lipoprotein NlpD